MEDENLIECVRNYEFLYNLQHPKYMDSARKEMAWKEISTQLRLPAATCKRRWQGLRDSYRRALNKKKSRGGLAAKNIKKWKYEEEMSFVASYISERKPLESTELTSDDEETHKDDTGINNQNPYSNNEINRTDGLNISASKNTKNTEDQNKYDTVDYSISSQQQHQAKKAKIKRLKIQPVQSASAVLMSRFLDTQIIPQQPKHDELDRFFLNISETVKKFSLYQQAIAKNKIFRLVSEMEIQQLAPPNLIKAATEYTNTVFPPSTSSVQTSAPPMPSSETLHNSSNICKSENVFE